ncbi:MAG: hypothetical protein M5R36_18215 [Deltaproteobacteria bacterium]|nr:hypothetical protein [Deltaproteobacteria bacterium]
MTGRTAKGLLRGMAVGAVCAAALAAVSVGATSPRFRSTSRLEAFWFHLPDSRFKDETIVYLFQRWKRSSDEIKIRAMAPPAADAGIRLGRLYDFDAAFGSIHPEFQSTAAYAAYAAYWSKRLVELARPDMAGKVLRAAHPMPGDDPSAEILRKAWEGVPAEFR